MRSQFKTKRSPKKNLRAKARNEARKEWSDIAKAQYEIAEIALGKTKAGSV